MDAIAYIRWSTQDQSRGDSEKRQQQLALVTCEARKWQLTEVVIENGKSAYHGRHRAEGGKFAEIEKRAALGELRGMGLLIEQLDRLSRQEPLEGLNLLSNLTKAGVTVVETTSGTAWTEDSVRENWTSLLTAFIKAGLAFDESFNKAKRIRSAWRTTQSAGLTKEGKPDPRISPNWIEVVDDEWRVIEGRAAVIRQAFEWSAQGLGSRQIALRLNDIPTGRWARGKWRPANINFIIKGRQALGEYLPQSFGEDGVRRPCGDWIKLYPAIISEELWSRANEALSRRQSVPTGGPRRRMTNILSGMAYCGVCGGKLTQRGADATKKQRLICSSYHRGAGCRSNTTYVYPDLLNNVLDLMLAVSLPEPTVGDDITREIDTLAHTLSDKQTRLAKLVDAFSRTGSAAMERGIITLEADIEREETRLRELRRTVQVTRNRARPTDRMGEVQALRDQIPTSEEARYAIHNALSTMITSLTVHPPEQRAVLVLLGGLHAIEFTREGKVIREATAAAMLEQKSYQLADGSIVETNPATTRAGLGANAAGITRYERNMGVRHDDEFRPVAIPR